MTPIGAALAGLSPWRARGLCVLAGAGAALSLPPFDLWPLLVPALACVVALVVTAQDTPAAFGRAWWVGLGWFGLAMHWIVQPFFVEPEVYGWMAPFALVLMAGGLALFWGASGALAARLCDTAVPRVVAFSACLVLAEALRGRVLTGLPWAQPGHGWIGTELLALSALGGPLALSAMALAVAAALAGTVLMGRRAVAVAVLLAMTGAGWVPWGAVAPPIEEDAAVVRIVQINAPQHLKWDSDMIPVFFDRAVDLTGSVPGPLGPPDLVVWPETSLPELLRNSDAARARIAGAADGAQVIVGAQRYAGIEPRNVIALLDPTGAVDQVYDKHHLVPFGEYIPLRGLADQLGLRGLAQRMSGGYRPGAGPGLLDLGELGQAFPMICYEGIFPHYIRHVARPDMMVIATNDAWFGSFAMPHQHLALARLRAAEQGVPVIRAANTGISAVIDARGSIVVALGMDEAGVIDTLLPGAAPPTIYARVGDLPVLILAGLALLVSVLATRAIEARDKRA